MERHDRLRAARKAAGFSSATEAAAALGQTIPSYTAHENGGRGLTADAAIRYARFFQVGLKWLLTGEGGMRDDGAALAPGGDASQSGGGVRIAPVVGKVEAGSWVHVDDAQDGTSETIAVIPDPRFARSNCQAFKVAGDSFDEYVKDGGFVVAVPWQEAHMLPRDGLPVVVEQVRDGGFRQRTLKEIRLRNGTVTLVPRSTNANHKPVVLSDADQTGGDIETHIVALVITFIQPAVF